MCTYCWSFTFKILGLAFCVLFFYIIFVVWYCLDIDHRLYRRNIIVKISLLIDRHLGFSVSTFSLLETISDDLTLLGVNSFEWSCWAGWAEQLSGLRTWRQTAPGKLVPASAAWECPFSHSECSNADFFFFFGQYDCQRFSTHCFNLHFDSYWGV